MKLEHAIQKIYDYNVRDGCEEYFQNVMDSNLDKSVLL